MKVQNDGGQIIFSENGTEVALPYEVVYRWWSNYQQGGRFQVEAHYCILLFDTYVKIGGDTTDLNSDDWQSLIHYCVMSFDTKDEKSEAK